MRTTRRTPTLALTVVIGFGAVLRLSEFLGHRGLWIDEAMLALNVGGRTTAGQWGALAYEQGAPPLFMTVVKLITQLAGMGESALRFVPFAAGVLVPWLLWRCAKRSVGPGVALAAAALAASSVLLMRYSAEFKPYGNDAFATVVLYGLVMRARDAPEQAARWWQLAVGGALGFAFSLPLVFVAAGAATALVLDPRTRRQPRRLALLAAGWGGSLAGLYAAVYQAQSRNPYLHRYWEGTFFRLGLGDSRRKLYHAAQDFLGAIPAIPGPVGVWGLALLAAGGLVVLGRRHGVATAALIGVPGAAVLVASMLGQYPLFNRMLLFLAPLACIMVASLLVAVLRRAGLEEGAAGVATTLIVLGWSAPALLRYSRTPAVDEPGRISARYMDTASGAEPVFIFGQGIPGWIYYTTDWERPDTARLRRYARLARGAGPLAYNALLSARPEPGDTDLALRRHAAGWDLPGRRSGIAYREPGMQIQSRPDTGWARQEADRIAAMATRYVWVFGSHRASREAAALHAELLARGARPVVTMHEEVLVGMRYRLPSGAAPR